MNEEIRVRLPRLLKKELSGTVLKEAGRFHPISLSMELNMLPLSTATMTLAEDDLDVKVHDFVELYNQHGSVGIFRVASIEKVYRGRRRVELNHALDVLNDAIYATLNNDEEEFNDTPTAYITKMLGAQTQKIGNTAFWQLGTCADTESLQKKLRFQNVLEALCDLGKEHEDYYFTFDFSTFPWTLNFVARSNTVVSEFRLNRNIASCTVTVDDTDLCTRLYLSIDTKETVTQSGETAGEKTEQTFAVYNDTTAQAVWGVVAKSAGVEFASASIKNAKLQSWVNDYFARHNAPLAQISISGQDLKEITGVSIDEIQMGKICRVALPEYSEVFLERVVTVSYPDALRRPTSVKVSMANKRQTAEDSIAAVKKEASRAGGSGGGAAKKAENNETEIERQKIIYDLKVEQDERRFALIATEEWYEALDDQDLTLVGKYNAEFELTARHILSALSVTGVQYDQNGDPVIDQNGNYVFNGSNNSLSSQIDQTAASLTSLYTKTGANSLGQNETLYSKITQNATDISTLVTKSGINSLGQNETLYSQISQNATDISSLVTKSGVNSLGQNETLYSQIAQNASKIALVVSSSGGTDYINTASIVAGINSQTGSFVAISADQIDLTGYVKATDITANLIASKLAEVAHVVVNDLEVTGWMTVGSSYGITGSGNAVLSGIQLAGSSTFTNVIKSASVSGGTLTLTPASGNAITFTKAVTLTGAWGGTASAGKSYTVTASMNGGTVATHTSPGVINIVTSGSPTYNSSTKKLSQTCIVLDANDEDILQRSVVVNAADAYDAGYTDGEDSVDFDSLGNWNQGYALITLTNGKTTYGQMPSVNSATWTSYRQGTNLLVYCTIGGREYSHTFAV